MRERGIKLSVYFGERQRAGGALLADALLAAYGRHGIHTSVLLRGADGFGADHLHTDRLLSSSESLPALSIAIDSSDRIEHALPEVIELTAAGGMVTIERATLVTGTELVRSSLPEDPRAPVKLTLYGGRSARSGGEAGYVAAVRRLTAEGVGGASVLLAVDGTLHGQRRRARFFARNAGVPLMLLTIGTAQSLGAALPELAQLLDDPVATIERVEVVKSAGQIAGEPHGVPLHDPTGLPNWQKLTVHVEEQALHDGHPVHSRLLLALREAGAAGATVLRGVRGFYADREPFHDRPLSLRRNVPVIVIAIDRPDRVREWWPLVDELTAEHGLVTSELVPTSFTAS